MKRFSGIVLILLLITGFSVLSYADEGEIIIEDTGEVMIGDTGEIMTQTEEIRAYRLTIGEKAARGVKNILLGWTELPKRIIDTTQETGNPIWGLFVGTYEGALKAAGRTISGVSDVLTAPINPEGDPYIPADIEDL